MSEKYIPKNPIKNSETREAHAKVQAAKKIKKGMVYRICFWRRGFLDKKISKLVKQAKEDHAFGMVIDSAYRNWPIEPYRGGTNWYVPRHNYKTKMAHEYIQSAKSAKRRGESAEYISNLVKKAKGIHESGMIYPREHPGLR